MNDGKKIAITVPTVPLLVPGLILLLAGSHWFPGAVTVGWILVGASVAPLVVVLLLLVVAGVLALVAALVKVPGRRRRKRALAVRRYR